MRRYKYIIFCLWIVGCSTPQLGTVPPAPMPITIAYPPSLEPIMEAIYSCVNSHPEISIIVDKRPASAIDYNANDLTLWFGDKPEDVNVKGGFLRYGLVKNPYILVKGSVAGASKRLITLTKAIRPNKKFQAEAPSIAYVSKESKQGK